MKSFNIPRFVICSLLICLNASCGFNRNDEKAWRAKLCEGVWEKDTRLNGGGFANVKFIFDKNGTVKFDMIGAENFQQKGRWKFDSEDGENSYKSIVVNWEEPLYGYTQMGLTLTPYEQDKLFKLDCIACQLTELLNRK